MVSTKTLLLKHYYRCQGKSWGRGSGGVKSTGVSQSVRETSRVESQNVLSNQKLFKNKGFGAPNFLGISPELFAAPPRDTPVPLYTRTSPWPKKGFLGPLGPWVYKVRSRVKNEPRLAVSACASWFLSPHRIMQNHVKSWQIIRNHGPENACFCLKMSDFVL